MSNTLIIDGVEIDEKKANILLHWLIQNEKINIKTREKNDQQMVALIKKKIEEVVQCY